MAKKERAAGTVCLVVDAAKNPPVTVKAGQRLNVVAVDLMSAGPKRPKKLGARLCGGTSTCLALVDVSD